jgi:hypothetical protein
MNYFILDFYEKIIFIFFKCGKLFGILIFIFLNKSILVAMADVDVTAVVVDDDDRH